MGQKIREDIQDLIKEIAQRRHERHENTTAHAVLGEAKYILATFTNSYAGLPAKRKTEIFIKEAIESYEKLPENVKKHLEEAARPWSMGCLENYSMPPGVLPAVLKVRKLCMDQGVHFSILEAEWVARLHAIIINDLDLLRGWAYTYAFRQRISWVLRRPFDSAALDAAIISDSNTLPPLLEHEDLELLKSTPISISVVATKGPEGYRLETREVYHERTHNQEVQK